MEKDIFERMLEGGIIQNDDPQFYKVFEQVNVTKRLSVALNNATEPEEIRDFFG